MENQLAQALHGNFNRDEGARAALDAQRRRYQDQLAQAINYDSGMPRIRRPMSGSYSSNGMRMYIDGNRTLDVRNFMDGISKQRSRRAKYLLNVPKEPVDDWHRLAFSRAIRIRNGSDTHRGIYGF